MRTPCLLPSRLRPLLLALAVAPALGTASAATLDWEGTLFVQTGFAPPATLTGTGVATVNGTGGGLGALNTLRLAGGIVGTSTVPPLSSSAVIQTVTVKAALGTGTFKPVAGGGPLTQNLLPIPGNARISLLTPGCIFCLTIPSLTQNGSRGVGVGGTISTGPFTTPTVIQGNPWTLGTAKITFTTFNGSLSSIQATGFAHGPASGSSTAMPGGLVQAVTPTTVTSPIASGTLPVLTTLRIRFVPEPTELLLLAPAVGLLALLGRGRARD